MDTFLKVTGGILLSLIFYLILIKQNKDISIVLTVTVCVIVLAAIVSYIRPVVNLITQLSDIGNLDNQMLSVLCKAVGISLLTEIVGQVCADAGNSTMGKTIQILSSSVILWLSIPLFTKLMDLIKEILVAV